VTQNLSQPTSNQRPVAARVASAAGRLCSNGIIGMWESALRGPKASFR
jgi:hypothetical protein